MIEILKSLQLDLMLALGSMCALIAFFILITGMDTKKNKILFILETGSAILLIATRLTWLYNAQPGTFSRWVVLISNFLNFFGVVVALYAFNMYLWETIAETKGANSNLIRFRIINILLLIDVTFIFLSPLTGLYYFIDENNKYNRGPLIAGCFLIPLIIQILFFSIIVQYYSKMSKNMRLPLLLFATTPLPASILQFCFYGLESTNITIVALAILLYIFDLLDIKKTADMSLRAIAANEAKTSFLSNMSHEIRTPINAVLGMNEMILRECDNPKILSYSGSIKRAGSALLGIINDILDISRIEAGKIELLPARYDFSDLIYDLVNMIDTRIKAKGLELKLEIDPTIPKILNGDEARIRQVITNILTNAVKYTEKGSISFKITCNEKSKDPDRTVLRIEVSDTGIGIKKDDMEKLFSKFERIEEKRNRNIEGAGLGLSITKNLLEMMGSELKVESIYGKGSTFYFLLEQPVISWEELGDYQKIFDEHQKNRSKHTGRLKAPSANILVVDDYSMNLEVFRGLVKETLIQIDTAEDGATALKLAANKKYDIIFMDHMMPGKDGIETLKELKAQSANPNLQTPVICLTANAIYGAKEQYLSAGFNDYLTKPVDPDKLEEMLIKYLPEDKVSISLEEGKTIPQSSQDFSEKILKMFYESLDERLSEINSYYSNKDIENYTIKVHALKTGFRTVKAFELGEDAQQLENAGKQNDIKYIDSHYPEFLDKIASFKETLNEKFSKADSQEQTRSGVPADSQLMNQFFTDIRLAAQDMDSDRLDELFTSMKDYIIPEEHKDIYRQLQKASSEYEYKKILKLLGGE